MPCPTVILSFSSVITLDVLDLLSVRIGSHKAPAAIPRQSKCAARPRKKFLESQLLPKGSCGSFVTCFRADANGKLMGNTIAACLRAGGSFLQARRASFSRLETNIDQAEVSDRAILWHRLISMPIVIGGLSSSSVGDHHITTLQAHIPATKGSQFFQ